MPTEPAANESAEKEKQEESEEQLEKDSEEHERSESNEEKMSHCVQSMIDDAIKEADQTREVAEYVNQLIQQSIDEFCRKEQLMQETVTQFVDNILKQAKAQMLSEVNAKQC